MNICALKEKLEDVNRRLSKWFKWREE